MLDFNKKITNAISKGIYESLAEIDDDTEITVSKSGSSVLVNDAKNKLYDLVNRVFKYKEVVKPEEIEEIVNYALDYKVKYTVNDLRELKKIVSKFCQKKLMHLSLNWVDVSNIKSFAHLFEKLQYNGDISEWDTSNVINMDYTFAESRGIQKGIEKWDVSNVNSFNHTFYHCYFPYDLSNWQIKSDANMGFMFNTLNTAYSLRDKDNLFDYLPDKVEPENVENIFAFYLRDFDGIMLSQYNKIKQWIDNKSFSNIDDLLMVYPLNVLLLRPYAYKIKIDQSYIYMALRYYLHTIDKVSREDYIILGNIIKANRGYTVKALLPLMDRIEELYTDYEDNNTLDDEALCDQLSVMTSPAKSAEKQRKESKIYNQFINRPVSALLAQKILEKNSKGLYIFKDFLDTVDIIFKEKEKRED